MNEGDRNKQTIGMWLSNNGDMKRVPWEHTERNQPVLGGQEGFLETSAIELS